MSVAVGADYAEKQAARNNFSGIIGDLCDLCIQKALYMGVRADFFAADGVEMTGQVLYEFSDLHKQPPLQANKR
jgi:hypothetical protein